MQLNRLVLPAPFGPMSPTICPSMMSNETLSSAATPPKRRLTSRTESSGSSDVLTLLWPFGREGGHLCPSEGDRRSALDGFSADRCAPLGGTESQTRWSLKALYGNLICPRTSMGWDRGL